MKASMKPMYHGGRRGGRRSCMLAPDRLEEARMAKPPIIAEIENARVI